MRLGPTADASMPMHWNMGSSEGAFFFLLPNQTDTVVETQGTHPRICSPALMGPMIESRNGFISLPTAEAT